MCGGDKLKKILLSYIELHKGLAPSIGKCILDFLADKIGQADYLTLRDDFDGTYQSLLKLLKKIPAEISMQHLLDIVTSMVSNL